MFPTQLHPSLQQQPGPHEYYSGSQQPLGFSELFTRFHLFCELLIDSRSRLKMYKAVGEELVLRRNESEFVHKWRYSAQLLVVLWVTNHYKPHFKSISDESNVLNWRPTMNLYWVLSKFYNTVRLMLYNFTSSSEVSMRPNLGWSKLWLDDCESPYVPSPWRPSPRPRYSPWTTSTSTLR